MTITFDIKPEILEKYSEEQLKSMFDIFLIKIDEIKLEDDFIPTKEFLDFREENLEEFPQKTIDKFEALKKGKLTMVK
ncbi:MAG: hypothetical protein LBQ59_01615 [Candidatus Peribacteria bacterium]|jgi:uncharacterized protein (UPF0305 family)|nr:hypothetical protein [Candidatus Peribacteria bacterium]